MHGSAPGDWQHALRVAMTAWNDAGSAFKFRERARQITDDPCNMPGVVVVILADPNNLCPGDGPLTGGGRLELERTNYDDPWEARVYVNAHFGVSRSQIGVYTILLHELGHVVGLGHPDEAGQQVNAVMNSGHYYDRLQPDDIRGIQALYPRPPFAGFLENPQPDSHQSGIGVISGWVCDADVVEVWIGGTWYPAAYGTLREDTREVCGDTNNGFGLLWNWNRLGEGKHRVLVLVDDFQVGLATVTVTTFGKEFLRGAEGEYVLEDFPTPGQSVVIEWEQSLQNFVIQGVE